MEHENASIGQPKPTPRAPIVRPHDLAKRMRLTFGPVQDQDARFADLSAKLVAKIG